MTTSDRFDRQLRAFMEDGPDVASNRLLDAIREEVNATNQQAVPGLRRYITMIRPVLAAAVIAVTIIAGLGIYTATRQDATRQNSGSVLGPAPIAESPSPTEGELPSCGPLTVSNRLDALPGGEPSTVVLQEPYVAVMGERTLGNEQVAALHLQPTVAWDDPVVLVSIEGTEDMSSGELEGDQFNAGGWEQWFGVPGQRRIVLTGNTSGCVTAFDVLFVLDTRIRSKDARAGLSEPPPPAGPPG